MYRLHIEREIAIAHQLKHHNGKCNNPHGHNLFIEVDVESSQLICSGSSEGMVIDFGTVKKEIDELDHSDLNKYFRGNPMGDQPTAERLAHYLANRVRELSKVNLTKIKVRVHEARGQWAECEI